MTKWKSLAGKFTSEELEVIRAYQKMYGLNDNQLVKAGVLSMIFVYGSLFKTFIFELSKGYQKPFP